jgi:acyl-homoserine-lactone acylase
MTYSQSEDPDSPHFADQTERYGSGEGLRPVLFTEEALLADPGLAELQLVVTL